MQEMLQKSYQIRIDLTYDFSVTSVAITDVSREINGAFPTNLITKVTQSRYASPSTTTTTLRTRQMDTVIFVASPSHARGKKITLHHERESPNLISPPRLSNASTLRIGPSNTRRIR